MNEIVKQFAKETKLLSDWPMDLSHFQKFAHLIIDECARVCINELADPRDTIEQKCASKILRHFEEKNR